MVVTKDIEVLVCRKDMRGTYFVDMQPLHGRTFMYLEANSEKRLTFRRRGRCYDNETVRFYMTDGSITEPYIFNFNKDTNMLTISNMDNEKFKYIPQFSSIKAQLI